MTKQDTEKANYITCPKGHKVYVIWSPARQKFGFTCDECDQHSEVAISAVGLVKVVRVDQPGRKQ
jgi:hypothetical protein